MGIDESWLAGLIDGEGCFSISVWKRRNGISITPIIRVALTTEKTWLEKVESIYKKYKIPYYIYYRKPSGKSTYKESATISVKHKGAIKKLCNIIKKYSTVKSPHIDLFLNLPWRRRTIYTTHHGIYLIPKGVEDWANIIDANFKITNSGRNKKWSGDKIRKFYYSKGYRLPIIEDVINSTGTNNKNKIIGELELRYKSKKISEPSYYSVRKWILQNDINEILEILKKYNKFRKVKI